MKDLIKQLQKPLESHEIDFRVQSINKGGYATILPYKDARVDMQRLDQVFTPLGWKREHLNGNANCIVSIYNHELKEWISKEDTGVESNAEAKKGLASDSFKRACFNWGIGRELYDYPVILIKLNNSEFQIKKDNRNKERAYPTWNFKLKEWSWFTQFNDDGVLSCIAAKDNNGEKRFNWGVYLKPELKEASQ